MAKYVAGIDAGTTGVTVMIADLSGNIIGSGYREYPCAYPHPGWVEQDIDLVWKNLCDAAKEALAKTGVNPREVGSLGLSSQRGTFVAVDRDWNPLHNSIVWNDTRAIAEEEGLAKQLGRDAYHDICGVQLSATWSYCKFKWVRDHQPALYEKAYKFVNGQEFFLKRLGADDNDTDPASLTLNAMMDADKLDWSEYLMQAIDVDLTKLPRVSTPMRQVGRLSAQAATLTGFAEGMPICAGAGDQQCAAIGSGVIREGLAEITVGTSSVMVAHVDSRKADPHHKMCCGGHAIPGKWDMEGIASATGACLRWWRDTYAQAEMGLAGHMGRDVYELIGMEAENAPVGCKGYMFFPFMNGQTSPYYYAQASGGSLGLALMSDRCMMARAVMEGGAFELRMIVEAMEECLGRPFDTIRLSGGGTKSKLWCQIQADVYGRPVEQLKTHECTTLGAAILGATAAGIFANIEEAVQSMVHYKGVIAPDMKNHALYSDMFALFTDTFTTLRDQKIYERLNAVRNKYWG